MWQFSRTFSHQQMIIRGEEGCHLVSWTNWLNQFQIYEQLQHTKLLKASLYKFIWASWARPKAEAKLVNLPNFVSFWNLKLRENQPWVEKWQNFWTFLMDFFAMMPKIGENVSLCIHCITGTLKSTYKGRVLPLKRRDFLLLPAAKNWESLFKFLIFCFNF